MDSKDSSSSYLEAYWQQTILEDRAESAPPPASVEPEAER
jgi:hypothetical protein